MPAVLEATPTRKLTAGYYLVRGTSILIIPKTNKSLVPRQSVYLTDEELNDPVVQKFANDKDDQGRFLLEPISQKEAAQVNIDYYRSMAELAGRTTNLMTADKVLKAAEDAKIPSHIQRRYLERLQNWNESKIQKWLDRLATNTKLSRETRMDRLSFVMTAEQSGRGRETITSAIVGAMSKAIQL